MITPWGNLSICCTRYRSWKKGVLPKESLRYEFEFEFKLSEFKLNEFKLDRLRNYLTKQEKLSFEIVSYLQFFPSPVVAIRFTKLRINQLVSFENHFPFTKIESAQRILDCCKTKLSSYPLINIVKWGNRFQQTFFYAYSVYISKLCFLPFFTAFYDLIQCN